MPFQFFSGVTEISFYECLKLVKETRKGSLMFGWSGADDTLEIASSLKFGCISSVGSSEKSDPFIVEDELVAARIVEQLTGGEEELGVYNDTHCTNHFDARVFISVPKSYQHKDLFLGSSNFTTYFKGRICTVNRKELREVLRTFLERKIYIFVIDCVWDISVWNYFKSSFGHNSSHGSKILLTVPDVDVILGKICVGDFYFLTSFLTINERWVLLKRTVFGEQICPPELWGIGNAIAARCRGLHITINVVAALLTQEEKTVYFWEQVSQNITSYLAHRIVCTFDVDDRLRYFYLEDKKNAEELDYINQDIKMTNDKEVKKHYEQKIHIRIRQHEMEAHGSSLAASTPSVGNSTARGSLSIQSIWNAGQPVKESPATVSIPDVEKEFVVDFDKEA